MVDLHRRLFIISDHFICNNRVSVIESRTDESGYQPEKRMSESAVNRFTLRSFSEGVPTVIGQRSTVNPIIVARSVLSLK